MQILVKVDTGYLCNWREIEPLQPEGFKGQTANEKETLKNSIVKNGFHDAFDVWQHEGRLLSIDGVHRKIALLELAAEGYEIPEQLPCTYVTAENETEAATIILSRNSQHSHILSAAVMTAAFKIPAATIEAVVPQKNLDRWNGIGNDISKHEDNTVYSNNESINVDNYDNIDNVGFEKLALIRRRDLFIYTFYKVKNLELLKQDKSNAVFLANAFIELLNFFILDFDNYYLITTPARSHTSKLGYHFASLICEIASEKTGIAYIADAIVAKNKDKIKPVFSLNFTPPDTKIPILFDDIGTTYATIYESVRIIRENCVFVKNMPIFVAINNN